VHALRCKAIASARLKNDKVDAAILAQLLRAAAIAEAACNFGGRAPGSAPPGDAQEQAIKEALATVQAKHSTWTRSDVMKYLGRAMGPQFAAMAPGERQDLLFRLTGQALGGDGVRCLEAPEWPPVRQQLRRDLDGRSVYTRPGTARYATAGQLEMEGELIQQAQTQGAPRLPREVAARLLGADAGKVAVRAARTAAWPRDPRSQVSPWPFFPARVRGPDWRAEGHSPAQDTRWPAVGNRVMSRPVSAMMARARPGLMPGISASRATAFSAGSSGPVPAPGPVVPSASMPQAAGIAAASSAARAPSWAILPSREEIWSSSRWGELAVVVVGHAVQGLDEVIALGLHAAAGQGGQLPRVALAGDHRLDHVLRRDGGQLAGHR
jgi:hypothetical protein